MSQGRLPKLLELAKTLPEVEQRKVAAMVGACVGDAAARPMHWVYDMSALNSYLKNDGTGTDRTKNPEFFPENRSPFYSLPTGENSCYWDISGAVLDSLGKNQESKYDYQRDVCHAIDDRFFGPETDYSLEKRQNYMQLRAMGMTPDQPIQGRWFNGSLIKFKENRDAKKKLPYGDPHIKETDGFCAALPVALVLSNNHDQSSPPMTEIISKCQDVIKTLSSWPTAVSHGTVAVNIMMKLVSGSSNAIDEAKKEAIDTHPDVAKSIQGVHKNLDVDHVTAVGFGFGRPCYNPGSFQGAIHAFLTSEDFPTAVQKTIRAGGCCCSRSFFAGAMAGARYGLDGIPKEWMDKTTNAEKVLEDAINAFKD